MPTTHNDLREALRRTRPAEPELSADFADRLLADHGRRRQSLIRRIAAVAAILLCISGIAYAAVRLTSDGFGLRFAQRDRVVPPEELEVLPEFPGGVDAMMQYYQRHLHYPEQAMRDSIEGRVIVSFIVEKDGRLTGIHIAHSLSPSTDSAAVSLVRQMPRWIPAYAHGRPVRSQFVIPISYRLNKGAGAPLRTGGRPRH